MSEWLNHPALQSGLAPFLAALIVAALFDYVRLSGLVVLAGFCTVVYLTLDFNFESLSITKKIVLSGLVAGGIAPLLAMLPDHWWFVRYVLGVAAGAVTLWVFWPVLAQKNLLDGRLLASGLTVWVVWLVVFSDFLSTQSVRAGAAGMGLGLGTGISAMLGASALLGQWGLAVGAACGAYLILQFMKNRSLSCGRTFTLPVSLLSGLLASAALLLARLPWYCLPVLAMIPLIVRLPIMQGMPIRIQVVGFSLLTLSIVAVSTGLVWYTEGTIPL